MQTLPRDRQRPLKVWVSPAERQAIQAQAAATGLSVSAYLRAVGLGHQPKAAFDQDAVLALVKAHADQGRLRDALHDVARAGQAAPAQVGALLHAINALQQQLQAVVQRL